MREIPGFKDYFADKEGNIYTCRKGANFRRMSPAKDRYGYLVLHVSPEPGQKRRNVFVHRLVGMAYHQSGYFEGLQINHKNSIRADNRPENLEWVTLADNVSIARKKVVGELHHGSVLTNDQVMTLRMMCAYKLLERKTLCELSGISKATLYRLTHGQSWRHLPG